MRSGEAKSHFGIRNVEIKIRNQEIRTWKLLAATGLAASCSCECTEESIQGAAGVPGAIFGSVGDNTEAGPETPRKRSEDKKQEGE